VIWCQALVLWNGTTCDWVFTDGRRLQPARSSVARRMSSTPMSATNIISVRWHYTPLLFIRPTFKMHVRRRSHYAQIELLFYVPCTRYKTGHVGDVPQANLLACYGKTKRITTKAHNHRSKEMYYNTKSNKNNARFSHDIRRGPILILALHQFLT